MEIAEVRKASGSAIHLVKLASLDPETVAVADVAGNVLFVDEDMSVLQERVHPDVADVALISSRGSKVFAFAEPHCVTLVRVGERLRTVEHFRGHEGRVTGLALFGDEGILNWVVSADERGNVLRRDATNATSPTSQRIHRKAVSRLAATRLADGRNAFLTTSDDRQVLICDVGSGELLVRLAAHAGWVEQVAPLSQGGCLWGIAVVDRVGLTVWDAKTGLAVGRLSGKSTADIATFWHPRCGTLVTFSTLDTVALWSLNGLVIIPQPTPDVVRACAVTIDATGRISVLAGVGDTILVSKPGDAFEETGIRFPAPILRWHPWSSGAGVLVVLEDWSIWNAVVSNAK